MYNRILLVKEDDVHILSSWTHVFLDVFGMGSQDILLLITILRQEDTSKTQQRMRKWCPMRGMVRSIWNTLCLIVGLDLHPWSESFDKKFVHVFLTNWVCSIMKDAMAILGSISNRFPYSQPDMR